MACGILVPDKGSNPCPLQWKRGVLTTGPPGKSPENLLMTPHHLQNIKARHFNVVSKVFLDVPSQTLWACLLLFPACDLRFRSAPTSSAFSHLPISAAPSAFNDLDSLPFTLKSITTSLFSHWPGSVATHVCLLSPCACLC